MEYFTKMNEAGGFEITTDRTQTTSNFVLNLSLSLSLCRPLYIYIYIYMCVCVSNPVYIVNTITSQLVVRGSWCQKTAPTVINRKYITFI